MIMRWKVMAMCDLLNDVSIWVKSCPLKYKKTAFYTEFILGDDIDDFTNPSPFVLLHWHWGNHA